MNCKTCGKVIANNPKKPYCYACWKKWKNGIYRNPCDGCGGEDCACCSYGNGY